MARYAEAAKRAQLTKIASASNGTRNHELNRAAYSLAAFLNEGVWTEGELTQELEGAAIQAGLDRDPNCGISGIRRTIASGLRAVPAIISPQLFEAAQQQGQDNRNKATRNTRHIYLLQGRARCADCGRLFGCEADVRRPHLPKFYYKCYGQRLASSANFVDKQCHRSLHAHKWDALVWERLTEIFKHPELILSVVEERQGQIYEEAGRLRGWLASLEQKLAQVDQKRKQLLEWALDNAVADSLPKEMLAAKAKELADEQNRYEVEVNQLRQRLEQTLERVPNEEEIRRVCA